MRNEVCCSILNFVNKYFSDTELTDLVSHYIPMVYDAGFEGMEIYLNKPGISDIRRIRKVSRHNNMPISAVHFPKTLLDEPKSECIPQIKGLVEASLSLGCNLGIVHPPWPGTFEASNETLISVLYDILPWTELKEFRFSIETTPIRKCEVYFQNIINEFGLDLVYITMDMEFLATVGFSVSDFCEAINMLPENIHVNDYDGSPVDTNGQRRYPILGTGIIDYVKEGVTLSQLGYEGILTLETSLSHLNDPMSELVRSCNLILEKMA